jgi:adenosylmethionine-8-amino-7-oxononanoate aminotransferase
MATEPIYAAHYGPDRATMFFHSSSYTANPIACAAANANLAIWREEPVAERIATLAHRQAKRLAALTAAVPVANPRQLGTITAIDVVGATGYLADCAPRLLGFFREHDLLLRPLGNTVYVMPPYCIGEDDLDAVYAAIAAACTHEAAIAR